MTDVKNVIKELEAVGIHDVKEVVYNPSYEQLFEEETKPGLEGFEKGTLTTTGAVAVDTGIFTGRSPKDKYIVLDDTTKDTVWWLSLIHIQMCIRDRYVRAILPEAKSPVCGFRYFNVYGPREGHKGSMASVAFHLNNQILKGENPKLFAGSEHFRRDFVYVGDVAQVNIWCWQNGISGIFNCGTGNAESFAEVAKAVIKFHGKGVVETIPFPEHLKSRYQEYTQANLEKLRATGYDKPFKTVAEGVAEYMAWLNK